MMPEFDLTSVVVAVAAFVAMDMLRRLLAPIGAAFLEGWREGKARRA